MICLPSVSWLAGWLATCGGHFVTENVKEIFQTAKCPTMTIIAEAIVVTQCYRSHCRDHQSCIMSIGAVQVHHIAIGAVEAHHIALGAAVQAHHIALGAVQVHQAC